MCLQINSPFVVLQDVIQDNKEDWRIDLEELSQHISQLEKFMKRVRRNTDNQEGAWSLAKLFAFGSRGHDKLRSNPGVQYAYGHSACRPYL